MANSTSYNPYMDVPLFCCLPPFFCCLLLSKQWFYPGKSYKMQQMLLTTVARTGTVIAVLILSAHQCPVKWTVEIILVFQSNIEAVASFSSYRVRSFTLTYDRDIHIECSKQFKWNVFFYVSGQSPPFWAALKLL